MPLDLIQVGRFTQDEQQHEVLVPHQAVDMVELLLRPVLQRMEINPYVTRSSSALKKFLNELNGSTFWNRSELGKFIRSIGKNHLTVFDFLSRLNSKLIDRLDNMKKHAAGNGSTQCVLCADGFGMLGTSAVSCVDCHKVRTTPFQHLHPPDMPESFHFSPFVINVPSKLSITNRLYPCVKFAVKTVK